MDTQLFGQPESKLSNTPTTPPTNGGGAPAEVQRFGGSVPLSSTPTNPPTHTKSQAEIQQIGDSIPLTREASKPWAQSALPMSNLQNQAK